LFNSRRGQVFSVEKAKKIVTAEVKEKIREEIKVTP